MFGVMKRIIQKKVLRWPQYSVRILMSSMKSLFSLCQIGTRQMLRSIPQNYSSKRLLLRYIHKTGVRACATAATSRNLNPVSITSTFPTRHQSIKISFDDDLASDFQYIWLRDNCQCGKCIHPENKQKMLDTVSLDINIKPKSYHVTEDGRLKVIWPENDGSEHISHYDSEWLHKYGKGFELDVYDSLHDNLPPMITWNAEQIKKIMPEITYKEVMETEEGLNKWLELMYKYGLVIMKGVPCQKGEVIKVVERVAYVKKTKWGSSFDVLCEPVQTDPNHLAYTGMYLEHHTDMNYLEKSPGLQALHCLKANPSKEGDSIGGQSFFVDGFYIAKWLQNEHPSSFHSLTTTLVEFKIHSHNMEYKNHEYVLCASKTGTMQEVHYNTRTMAPLKGPADAVQPFYEAYKRMGQKMRESESEFAFNLVPGDLVAFNNRRVLHGRTSFDPMRMSRHLEGCYGDIDEVITRFRSYFTSQKK